MFSMQPINNAKAFMSSGHLHSLEYFNGFQMHMSLIRIQARLIMTKNHCHQMAIKLFQPSSIRISVSITRYVILCTVFEIEHICLLCSTFTLKIKGNFNVFLKKFTNRSLIHKFNLKQSFFDNVLFFLKSDTQIKASPK